MKIKCGIDIIEIERIKRSIENLGISFLNKIYTEKEIEYCESKGKQKYQHYAARFAAKEATYKAISEEFGDDYYIHWKNYEVINKPNGKPSININESFAKNIESVDLSISHCKEYATANVVIGLENT